MSMFTSVAPKMIDHKAHAYYSFLCGINIVETKVCSLSCKHCIYIYICICNSTGRSEIRDKFHEC